jgi:hypothetical protein
MVSRKISDLSDNDLRYLEEVLGKEFARQSEYRSQFKAKNGYTKSNDPNQLPRLISAIRSQRSLASARLEKW